MAVYENQYAWVSWGSAKSDLFDITNGTRQGSVASPVLWAVYCDPLIQELRDLGIGAHVGGMFMGVTMYADDLLLIAPTRGGMQQMLKVCEDYAIRFNISFSTDPDPNKSKSKCIFMIGDKKNLPRPAPLTLGGRELPWVSNAVHLGHELHESGKMDHDAKVKRAEFISKSVELRETFGFASPVEVLQAHKLYCSSFYGSMLWNLSGEAASQVFSAWSVAVRLSWSCPRDTRTYLMQQVLSCGMDSAKTDILVRYAKFFKSLRTSPSREVRVLANLVSRDIRTPTGSNIRMVEDASGLSVWNTCQLKLREEIRKKELVEIENQEKWRIPYLSKLLGQRQELVYQGMDKEEEEMTRIDDLINSLCTN